MLCAVASIAFGMEVTATSTLRARDDVYAPSGLVDGELDSAWVEGAAGLGEGVEITFTFEGPTQLDGLVLFSGFHKTPRLLEQNAVPVALEVAFDEGAYQRLELVIERSFDEEREVCVSPASPGLPHLWIAPDTIEATVIKVRLAEVYPGTDYPDAVLSELQPLRVGTPYTGPEAAMVEGVRNALVGMRTEVPGFAARTRISFMPSPRIKPWEFAGSVMTGVESRGLFDHWADSERDALYSGFGRVETVLGGVRFIAARSETFGDGEWIETFPVIEWNNQGALTLASVAVNSDGAPGCRHRLPEWILR